MNVSKKSRPVLHVAGEKTPGNRNPLTATAKKESTPASVSRTELVAMAAYYRAEKRSFSPGAELEDWLAAEREVDAALGATIDKTAAKK
jgi:hypothetical protein